jgi:hypothetical protein
MDNIRITDLPDGGAIVEMDGEVTVYSAEEIAEMEQDYKAAILRLLNQKYAQ